VIRESARNSHLAVLPLTEHGMRRTLYAAVRKGESAAPYMADFISIAQEKDSKGA
jgi:LysR family transcriptional regulator for metE and metH